MLYIITSYKKKKISKKKKMKYKSRILYTQKKQLELKYHLHALSASVKKRIVRNINKTYINKHKTHTFREFKHGKLVPYTIR